MTGGESPSAKPSNKLYVGNLDYKATTEDLNTHFQSAKGFVSADVSSSNNGRSRGYGIVEFKSVAAAEHAITEFNESTIGERKIFVRLDRGANVPDGESKRELKPRAPREPREPREHREPREPREHREPRAGGRESRGPPRSNIAPLKVRPEDDGRLLYVGNIPFRISWQDIKDYFREMGPVIRVDIPMDRATRRSRGFATVLFEKPEDALMAIEKLNNTELGGRTVTVRLDQYVGGKKEE